MHPYGHVSLFLTCIKVLYSLAVIVNQIHTVSSLPCNSWSHPDNGEKDREVEKDRKYRDRAKRRHCLVHNQDHTRGRVEETYNTAVPARGFWGQVSVGQSKGIWLEAELHMSVMTAVSPAHPWHVHGMIGAQWVGQLACAPRLLALFLTFPPTAFQQLDCIDNSRQVLC